MNAVLALARRDFLVQRSYPIPFVFDLVWGATNVILWFFVSRVMGASLTTDLGGAPTYFAFAVAGVIAALVVESATSEIAWRIREDQMAGTLEFVLAQPLRTWEVAAGAAAFPFGYALVRAGVYLALAILALDLPTDRIDWPGVVVVLLLAGAAFGGIGILAAAVTVVVKRGAGVVDALVFAMTFVSGAMFPRSVLPDWLRPVGAVMPTRPAFDGLRDALFRGGGWGAEAGALAAIACVLLPVGVAALALAIGIARRRGSLGQY